MNDAFLDDLGSFAKFGLHTTNYACIRFLSISSRSKRTRMHYEGGQDFFLLVQGGLPGLLIKRQNLLTDHLVI